MVMMPAPAPGNVFPAANYFRMDYWLKESVFVFKEFLMFLT